MWQGEKVDSGSERGISAVDEIVKIAGYPALESVHHHLHLLIHRLYLCEDRRWSRIHKGWVASSPSQSHHSALESSKSFARLLSVFRYSCTSKT